MRVAVTILIVVIIASIRAAAQSDPKPELIDEFPASMCSDDLKLRIDLYLVKVVETVDSRGAIMITPDRSMPGRALKYREVISAYVRFRGFDLRRIDFKERPIGDSQIQLWVIPKGASLNKPDSEPKRITETTLFDASEIIVHFFTLQIGFGGSWGDEPCDFGLIFEQFANVLKADSGLTAHLLFTSGGGITRKRTNAALKIAVKSLTDLGISPRRIVTKYVGARKHAEMQLWLVPEGGKKPIFRKDAVPN